MGKKLALISLSEIVNDYIIIQTYQLEQFVAQLYHAVQLTYEECEMSV